MKALFITYNGALEPLIKSQGIPYLKGLSAKGIGCILLSFEKPAKDREAFKEKAAALKRQLKDSGIEWFWLRYHKKPSFAATFFDIFIGIMFGFWIAVSRKVDIIHSRATVPALIGYVIARSAGRKLIFDERGLMAEEYADGGMWKRNGLLYRLTRHIEKLLLMRADKVVVLTENIKEFLLKTDYLPRGKNTDRPDITVIPSCVDTALFNSPVPTNEGSGERRGLSGKFVFLYTGSLGTWYLLDEMIDFFIAAKSLVKNAHFMILTHTGTDIAKEAWGKRGLSFSDVTIKEAEFERMPYYIRQADCGIFFIKPVLSKRSSCPIKFAEYLACGVPVVINSNVGDTDRIVERYRVGSVVSRFSKEEYSGAVNHLLELKREGKALSDRCRGVAEELFSLDAGVSRYLNIYMEIKGR